MSIKKISMFAGLILLLFIVGALTYPVTVMAAEGDTGSQDCFNWTELSDGTVQITGYTGSDGEVEIPNTLDGKVVSVIGENAFKNKDTLTSINLPNSVTKIGNNAFAWCGNLISIKLSDSLKTIGGFAFAGCGIESIEMPDSLMTIADYAFTRCTSLTSIKLSESLMTIGWGAFEECISLASIKIPNSVTMIDAEAFKRCVALEKVIITNKTLGFNDSAFMDSGSVIIYGYEGSVAQTSAEAVGIPFHPIYTVSFDSIGGSSVADIIVESGSTINAPTTKENYTFGGWYLTAACSGEQVSTVTADVTLYAKWIPVDYTIQFNSQGGSVVNRVTAPYQMMINITGTPTKSNNTFGGWYETAACSGTQVVFPYTVSENVTLYAKWVANPSTPTPRPTPIPTPIPTLISTPTPTQIPTPTHVPILTGGTWDFDEAYFELIENEDGTLTIRSIKTGTTTVTYMDNNGVTTIPLTIENSELLSTKPKNGVFYVLGCLSGLLLGLWGMWIVKFINKSKKSRNRAR